MGGNAVPPWHCIPLRVVIAIGFYGAAVCHAPRTRAVFLQLALRHENNPLGISVDTEAIVGGRGLGHREKANAIKRSQCVKANIIMRSHAINCGGPDVRITYSAGYADSPLTVFVGFDPIEYGGHRDAMRLEINSVTTIVGNHRVRNFESA